MSSSIQENSSKEKSPKEWNEIFNNPSFIKEYFYPKNDLGSTYTKTNTIIIIIINCKFIFINNK